MNKMLNSTNREFEMESTIRNYEPEFEALIRQRLGIILRYKTSNLNKTIAEACKKFHCRPIEYLEMLHNCPDDSFLLEHLIVGITIGETYFFRDKNQMQLLFNEIFPEIIQKKRKERNLSLRIWSAGCSSGEEIYTIAMMLSEILTDLKSWTVHLLATDINAKMLKKAMDARYGEWSMRSITPSFKKKYFVHKENAYRFSQQLRDLVRFEYLNLKDDRYPSINNGTNAQDLILCRNVLIYFDNECIKQLMLKLYNSLIPGGYLVLGASDPIDITDTNFIFHHKRGILFSRPIMENDKKSDEDSKRNEKKVVTFLPDYPTINDEIPSRNLINITSSATAKINSEKCDSHERVTIQNTDIVTNLLNQAQWQAVLDKVHQYELMGIFSVFLTNAKATALANLGKLEEAVKLCQESLLQEPTNKFTYFTYAMVLAELNRFEESESALRKTLFLDNTFVAGHFQLGLLLLRNKRQEAGVKSLQNALTIAGSKDPSQIVPGSQGVCYGHFAVTVKHEIDLYLPLRKSTI